MIKINIKNSDQVEEEYVDAIIDHLARRIRCVKKALDYLNGLTPNILDGEISFMKTATIAVIREIDSDKEFEKGRKYTSSDFKAATYVASVQRYLSNPNSIDKNQLTRVSRFLDYLLMQNNKRLKILIKCKPNNLKTCYLLLSPFINHIQDLFYLKLAFNYKEHEEISKLVKDFYREKNFIKYCPYCNLDKVEFFEDEEGATAARHDLDHFYDKATFPLLCYSMYNLVPSDITCNQTNKGTIEFTNEYHLNPYQDGFNNSMVFRAELNNKSSNKYKVVLKSNEAKGSPRYKKIFGKLDDIKAPRIKEFGNVNAFKLDTRYQNEKEYVSTIAKKIYVYDKNAWDSIKKYLVLLKKSKIEDSYKVYYKDNFFTPFDKESFGDYKYAKLNRDIHDQFFNQMFGNKNSLKKKLEYVFYKVK